MRKSFSYWLVILALCLVTTSVVYAQLSYTPPSFAPKQVIPSATFNTLFTTIDQEALNRTGGTMTGALLFSADNTHDIGASGATRARDLFLGRNAAVGGTLTVTGTSTFAAVSGTTGTFSSTLAATGATTLSSTLAVAGAVTLSSTLGVTGATTLTATLAVNSTSAAAIDVAGGITAGSGNVAIVDTTGKIPAISSTYFASLSGANLTSIPETAITDGSLLSRVADTETFSGLKTFSNTGTTTFAGSLTAGDGLASRTLTINGNSTNASMVLAVASNPAAQLAVASGDLFFDYAGTLSLRSGVAGTTRTTLDANGVLTHGYAVVFSNTISPTALSTGNNNNYAPTGVGSAFLFRLDGGAGSPVLTGLSGGAAGRLVVLCHVAGSGITIAAEDANSSAANRFMETITLNTVADGNCATFIYDGTSSRWRHISVTA